MEQKIRGDLFEVIRHAMKSQHLTYTDLGTRLGLSEATIKRLFQDKDCKLSRLLEICDELDISVTDVIDKARRPRQDNNTLPEAIEEILANNPPLFQFLVLILDDVPISDIKQYYNLDQADIILYARDLEKLGLTEKEMNGQIRLKNNEPIKFRHRGPLHRMIMQKNTDFFKDIMDRNANEDDILITVSRKMQKETAGLIRKELADLRNRIHTLAAQDQSLITREDLHTFKMCCSWGSVDFRKLIKLPSHPDKKTQHVPNE